ncbi:hypothetical protein [Ramlibacter albus]|uniref:Uncharacterized protein n=1 Tax=Ramlibacter albus TaxID=2079448 RepID=A0A923ME74_9BURK|nr:hypothetical protein [Ramlibacter albus]MBC5768723.1 hypothetical protein [Ramlibacter albus]
MTTRKKRDIYGEIMEALESLKNHHEEKQKSQCSGGIVDRDDREATRDRPIGPRLRLATNTRRGGQVGTAS